MSCSSSRSRQGECTWWARRRIPTLRGSRSKLGTSPSRSGSAIRFLLHDRDAKFSGPFDEVFRTEEVRVIRTPILAPRANAFAERFVRTVRSECLDHVLVYGRRHLDRVLRVYVSHYTEHRPHRGLDLATPRGGCSPRTRQNERGRVGRRDVLGGLIHEYQWAA